MNRRRITLVLVLAGLMLARTIAAQEVEEHPSVLPEGPYRDEVFYLCTACHSSRLIRNQAMSQERWDETLTWMSERHGMPELQGEERKRVLDYLTAHLGPAGKDEPKRSPFLTQPQRKNPFAPN
jgi:hypothetical protein